MIIIKFFLLVVLLAIICGVVMFWGVIKNFYFLFRQIKKGINPNANANQNAQRNTTYRTPHGDETITDMRNPQQANQKIFSSDEGEYVDFTEEKN